MYRIFGLKYKGINKEALGIKKKIKRINDSDIINLRSSSKMGEIKWKFLELKLKWEFLELKLKWEYLKLKYLELN
jgi:hypothetical protein